MVEKQVEGHMVLKYLEKVFGRMLTFKEQRSCRLLVKFYSKTRNTDVQVKVNSSFCCWVILAGIYIFLLSKA